MLYKGDVPVTYPHLDFDRDELSAAMREAYDDLIEFVMLEPFQKMYSELMALPFTDRPTYVMDVIMNPEVRASRGLRVPEGILLVTSAFGDRRPTLLAVKKYLPKKFHGAWENVNWTFVNEFDDDVVSKDPEKSWRPPLPIALQNEVISRGGDLEAVPDELGINYDTFVKFRDETLV